MYANEPVILLRLENTLILSRALQFLRKIPRKIYGRKIARNIQVADFSYVITFTDHFILH